VTEKCPLVTFGFRRKRKVPIAWVTTGNGIQIHFIGGCLI
jgi:hypothetical protein